jgi:hypothetical protein
MAISPYQSLFGMCEMEAALEYLLNKAAVKLRVTCELFSK